MAQNRDDFTQRTKELLAKRVGFKCSNPSCRKATTGAGGEKSIVNIGVAAHISAAATGGPRYDSDITSEQRKSFENGIWLCQSCSKLIDSDESKYTVDLLKRWKKNAEETAALELEITSPVATHESDLELVKFYMQCFDRPAFRDHISQEGSIEDFDKAIEDTIVALNTGALRTRDGELIKSADGKSSIHNPEWREKLELIVDILTAIRRRLRIAEKEKAYMYRNDDFGSFYCFYDRELEEWFNTSREEILKLMSSICVEAGFSSIHFHRRHYRW